MHFMRLSPDIESWWWVTERPSMQLLSVNVGFPQTVTWKGRVVTTGIFKAPVNGRVHMRRLNLDGDRQADLSVHGGADKAVYAYPCEHYTYWRGEFPGMELPWGMFGENFTVAGLIEEAVNIGDQFRIGSGVVMVTQPRVPCYKLAAKFGREDIIKRFLASGRSGFYCKVVQEGEVGAGDAIEAVSRDSHAITVADVARLYNGQSDDFDLLQRAVRTEALPEGWRDYFQRKIAQRRRE
jgi:MOSC domain-containing protein YiiM